MRESERGVTLLETLITCAIVATLLVAGGAWMMGMHPGALAQATDDYDAALSRARSIAMTSVNGATLVFSPITGRDGFTVRVYSGRPSGSAAVQSTTTMPVASDTLVAEKTLGTPPFAIFFGASGHVSGKARYPLLDASGNATFSTIAVEPSCPAGGFVLTFTAPSGATMTRTLPCTSNVAVATGAPNPSPTPNVPIVTPPQLVFYWPDDAQQAFVATEWGYTHWFASSSGLLCGGGVAAFPNVLPSPYSPASSVAEAAATPSPPPGMPYSYPNSATSMNDAPATFPLNPSAPGLCSAVVADDYGQQAHTSVQVMGWLTATYGGKAYTHLSSPALSLPSNDFPNAGSAVTIPLSKTYDAQALAPAVSLDAACSPYVKATATGGTTPGAPSWTPAQASITLSLVTMPGSKVDCGGTIYDQYRGSLGGEGISFNAAIGSAELDTWPPIVEYPLLSYAIQNAGGDICAADQPRALDASGGADAGVSPPPGFPIGFRTDSNGCFEHYNGTGWVKVKQNGSGWDAVSALVYEPGYTGAYSFAPPNSTAIAAKYDTSCPLSLYAKAFYSNSGPSAGIQGSGQSEAGDCGFGITSTDATTIKSANTVGISVRARNCETSATGIVYIAPGQTCGPYTVPPGDSQLCTYVFNEGGNTGWNEYYTASLDSTGIASTDSRGDSLSVTPSTYNPPLSGSYTVSRASGYSGPITIYVMLVRQTIGILSGKCHSESWTLSAADSTTYN